MKTVWIIGAGEMAKEYVKILDAMRIEEITVIGRGESSARRFEETTGHTVVRGGLEDYLRRNPICPQYVIVTVYPLDLKSITIMLLEYGVKKVLVEKPAGINYCELQEIDQKASQAKADVFVGYNRRFYSSVIAARKMIQEDGGVTSFNFEFTEWAHRIEELEKPKLELENWFMANSTHVVDLAFFLGGKPAQMNCFTSGALGWYSKASAFSGAGITTDGTPFSYKANWESAGRWSVEVLTKKRKILLEPLEQLKIQERGSLEYSQVKIEDEQDKRFKPGLFIQTYCFLSGDIADMLTINQQMRNAIIYEAMETNKGAYSLS